jgi:anti-sigma-K factor RskA
MTTPPDDILDLLTAYALGTIEPDELAHVSQLLAQRPELRTLLAELREAANALPYALPEATPPADLRQRTLDYATGRTTRAPARSGGIATRMRVWVASLGTLAAVAIVAAVVGWGQFFGATSQSAQMAQQVATAQTQLNDLQAQISEATRVLASLQGEAGQAALLETNSGQTVFVAKLPRLEPGRVYQLWRIQGNNAPASAGLFTVNQAGFGQASMTNGQPAAGEVIAVTNEPAGGSPGPTTNPLIASTVNA